MTATTTARTVERRYNHTGPRTPHTVHLREFTLCDGRRALIDRRAVAFLCEGRAEEFGGEPATIVAFRTVAKPFPVRAAYDEMTRWWRADASSNGATS